MLRLDSGAIGCWESGGDCDWSAAGVVWHWWGPECLRSVHHVCFTSLLFLPLLLLTVVLHYPSSTRMLMDTLDHNLR